MQKPGDITYGLMDRSHLLTLILLGLQQITIAALYLSLITIINHHSMITYEKAQSIIVYTWLAMVVAAVVFCNQLTY